MTTVSMCVIQERRDTWRKPHPETNLQRKFMHTHTHTHTSARAHTDRRERQNKEKNQIENGMSLQEDQRTLTKSMPV